MEPAPQVLIQCVTHNHVAFLPHFFSSLDAQTSRAFQVTMVDTASQDGSLAWLAEHRPEAVTLRNARAFGWSRGQNQGLAFNLARWPESEWSSHFLVFMAPNAVLAPTALAQIVEAFERDSALMFAVPRTLHAAIHVAEDEAVSLDRTPRIEEGEMRLTRSRRVMFPEAGGINTEESLEPREVFAASGACVAVRASVWQALGKEERSLFFDQDLSPFQAVLDVMWRARWAGLKIALLPAVQVWRVASNELQVQGWRRWRAWYSAAAREQRADQVYIGRVRLKEDSPLLRLRHAPWIVWGCVRRYGLLLVDPLMWPKLDISVSAWVRLFNHRVSRQTFSRISTKDMAVWFR